VARLVQDAFGVTLHPKHIPRFLRALGWTCRKPAGSSGERGAAAIARWIAREGPAPKRSPPATGQAALHR
jgi:transposase